MKKNIILKIFTYLFVFGLGVYVGRVYYQFSLLSFDEHLFHPADNNKKRTVTNLNNNEFLIMQSEDKTIYFDLLNINSTGAIYRWKYSTSTGARNSGSGKVFENYKQVGVGENAFLKDTGSKLHINIDDIQLKWSFHTATSSWIYYKPEFKACIANDSKWDEIAGNWGKPSKNKNKE